MTEAGPAGGVPFDDQGIAAAVARLGVAPRVVILTGAGLSADSGLRTFRDPDGHWKQRRPEDLATPQAFARDPCLVWSWYSARREAVGAARPNAAHKAIAEFAVARPGVTIVTQNVDSLHTMAAVHAFAGAASSSADAAPASSPQASAVVNPALPLELHGCLFRTRCTGCGRRHEDREPVDASSPAALPHCGVCGALLRPDVVWFGESLGEPIEHAFELAARAQACLVVGTSALVQPAASIALMTRRGGGVIIEVNPEKTPLTAVAEISLRATAAAAVPALLRAAMPA